MADDILEKGLWAWRPYDDPELEIEGTEHKPQKEDISEFVQAVQTGVNEAKTAALAGVRGYLSEAAMNADLEPDAGTLAKVDGGGTFIKVGDSGEGSWEPFEDPLEVVADAAVAAKADAETARDAAEGFKEGAETARDEAQGIVDGLGWQLPAKLGSQTGYVQVTFGYDADGFTRRLIDYATMTGRRRGQIDAQALEHPAPVDGEDYIAFQHDPGDGTWQIKTQRKSDGQVFTLTTGGVCVDPKFSADGDYVLYSWADAPDGTPKERYVPVEGGANYAVIPGQLIDRVGDSLTQFNTYGELVEALGLDWVARDYGRAFARPDEIAARVGAIDTILTVSGNVVPESGTVAVTALGTGNAQSDRTPRDTVQEIGLAAGETFSFSWNGKSFLLRTSDGNTYTVEQVAGEDDVAFPAATAVRLDQGRFADANRVVWAVTNGVLDEPLDVKAQVAAIVAGIKSWVKRYVVIGYAGTSNGSMNNPSPNYTKLAAINADLLATYGDHFIDPYKFLRGDAPYDGSQWPSALTLSGLGSFSSQGLTDIANGTWPIDFAADPGDRLHWSPAAYRALDKLIALIFEAKGWNP